MTAHRIRPLSAGDLPAMERLEELCFDQPWTPAALAAALSHKAGLALGLEVLGDLVAFALGQVVLDDGELHTISVDPANRRQGLGRHLLRAFMAECTRRGARHLFLEVRAGNTSARTLYHSEGFVELRRIRDYYGPGVDGVAMAVPLGEPPAGAFS